MSTQQPLQCPHCGSPDVSRSRRRLLERLLPIIKAFRCQSCQRRFRRIVPSPEKPETPLAP